MSKIQERIAELDKVSKKTRTVNNILWVFVFALVALAGYFAYESSVKEKEIEKLLSLSNDAKEKLALSESTTQAKFDSIIRASDADLWQQAKKINTLKAYSNYAQENPYDSIHKADLIKAVDNLLSNVGYVQYQETNGNKLYTVNTEIHLEGEYVQFKNDKAIRNGAIGINDCGADNSKRIDVINKGKTVRVNKLCEAPGSQSIWAEIAYSN
ncbi:hypothetical protein [Croceitalea sp. P059]|uniref:hypothetical protein n=1 Tax=Croceitalea sp. P059 TaxID=3075601 RepID=UPI002888C8E3|nr:hypothetical protein [Croceitalea sp. P059]MDT0540942.1 hypothetical protein [Croceitalea sp. P059]